jgi:hypothetical protein
MEEIVNRNILANSNPKLWLGSDAQCLIGGPRNTLLNRANSVISSVVPAAKPLGVPIQNLGQ